jgi:NADPH-dependent curcumin reductase CurA
MTRAREIHLVRRPTGMVVEDDFAVVETKTPDIGDGEVQIAAEILSVDPYMRPRLNADQPLNAARVGRGIGRIIQSRDPQFREGDFVRHSAGMRERFNSKGADVTLLNPDPVLGLSVYMHALGSTGLTAYGGLLEVGALKDGEQVFVSTAAGAVGSVAAQIGTAASLALLGRRRRRPGFGMKWVSTLSSTTTQSRFWKLSKLQLQTE